MRYEYECPACGEAREVSHGLTETPAVDCSCGASMERIISLSRVNLIDHKHAIVRYTNGAEARIPMKPHTEF